MSIPCINRVICRCYSSETLRKIERWLENLTENFIDSELASDSISFNLDHDYGFPAQMMTQMTAQINDDKLNISVLTYDHSQEYIAHHEFKQCKWHCCYENAVHPLVESL